ncbi:chondroitin sulfate proteoglycan 4-like [Phocoena sinus]|uniref:chondroitin sulfate proteoglycan 4-like n=1 Tax=Phocoena sinus TaxID=42100 RepID=UPI0013C40FA3|nr:chondroitin sulfate proteoglycan 4-like [Phocoena sinus]
MGWLRARRHVLLAACLGLCGERGALGAGENDYCMIELLSGNLQVRVNLGTGEQGLLSEKRLRVDDLVWHLVELYCFKDSISLVTDRHYEMTGQITGGMHSLHCQHGIYVAGHGGPDVPCLDGEIPNFRGCTEDVVFNQILNIP